MTNPGRYTVLIVVLGIAGCSARSTTDQAASADSQPSSKTNQAGSATSRPSETSSQAVKYFPDPQVRALATALERNDWAGAEKALHAGADVNAVGKDHIYPLGWTMYVKNKVAFEWLLNHGADPNFDSDGKASVLFWAAEADDPDWLQMLIAHKANPNLTHKTSIRTTETPLLAACGLCRLTNLKMLIAAGADINYQEPAHDGGGTPAINAACIGFFEGVYVLLKAGADIRPRTAGGFDLTSFVASHELDPADARYPWREKVLQLLRERGADVDGALKAASDAKAKDRKDNPWRYR